MANTGINFIKALKQNTINYMAAEANKQMLRGIVRDSLYSQRSLVEDRLRYSIVSSLISQHTAYGGFVAISSDFFGQRLKEALSKNNEKFMQNVFEDSQKLVPIDKRYAKAKRVRYISVADGRSMNYDGVSIYGIKAGSTKRIAQDMFNYNELDLKIKSGIYEESEANIIEELLTRHGKERYLYYAGKGKDTQTLHMRERFSKKNKYKDLGYTLNNDNTMFNVLERQRHGKGFTNAQPTGGYQELKNGGKLVKNKKNSYTIMYNAFDSTRPTNNYNYAALQHDNLAFKHKYGKAMFLTTAFYRRRRELYKQIAETTVNTVMTELKSSNSIKNVRRSK